MHGPYTVQLIAVVTIGARNGAMRHWRGARVPPTLG
jgi:hypothetical protein